MLRIRHHLHEGGGNRPCDGGAVLFPLVGQASTGNGRRLQGDRRSVLEECVLQRTVETRLEGGAEMLEQDGVETGLVDGGV